jgi:hypothetical protein
VTHWLKKHHRDRCARKEALPNAVADRLAQRASEKSGELIISYHCFDCGMWHIGHADESQIRAHKPDTNCMYCHKPIPKERLAKAERKGTRVFTCSKKCGDKLETLRKRGRSKGSRKHTR